MTPKEKAEQLVLKFRQIPPSSPYTGIGDEEAKQYALITVNETLLTLNKDIRDLDVVGNVLLDLIDYWNEVKQEIKQL